MKLRDATLVARAGMTESDSGAAPHVEPLYQTSVYDFPSIEASLPALEGREGYVYARHGLPNSDSLGRAVAALERAEVGLATSSGMAAISAAVLGTCSAGDRIVVQRDAYGGTAALFQRDFARLGISVDAVDVYDESALTAALPGVRLLLVESISNPLIRCVDLASVAAACRNSGTLLLVDNTFAPLARHPLSDGASLVVHSVTKFLGGHHDLCAGALVGARDVIEQARGVATRMGLVAAPFPAWLALRGMRTLDVRMRRAWANAAELARRLGEHSGIVTVHAADRCALVSFDVGSYANAEGLVTALELITLSPSLGGATTTISHPATSSHRALPEATRLQLGIGAGLLRLSVGIEDVEDVWFDLSRATIALS